MDGSAAIAFSLAFVNILYLVIAVGVITMNAAYIRWISIMVQAAVCLYLIYKFNPYLYRAYTLTRNDAYIIFWCAVFIGNNIIVSELANTRLASTVQHIKSEPTDILRSILSYKM